jgi:hypothetical protein
MILYYNSNKRRSNMPVIRITDATWDRLKRFAVPLEDTPEDAVRRVLDAAEEHLGCKPVQKQEKPQAIVKPNDNIGKLKKGQKTPQKLYRIPVLQAVNELGGRAPVDEILSLVGEKMKGTLTDVDYQTLPSGVDMRWRNTAMWERYHLVKDGLFKSDSPNGIWEISDVGKKYLANNSK